MPPSARLGLEPIEMQSGASRQNEGAVPVEQANADQVAHATLHGVSFGEVAGVLNQLANDLGRRELRWVLRKDECQQSALGLGVLRVG